MFVSGYVYCLTSQRKSVEYKSFIWNKFKRLLVPYFFVSILIITLKLLTERGAYLENPVTADAFFKILYLPTTAGYFLWFAYTLFLIFLTVPFFNSNKKLLVLLTSAFILKYLPFTLPAFFGLRQFQNMLLFYVLGVALCQYTGLRRAVGNVHIIWAIVAFAVLYILRHHIDVEYCQAIICLLLALSGIFAVIKFAKILEHSGKISRVLLNVAGCSYTIYLFHTTFMGFGKAIFVKIYQFTPPIFVKLC
jgi:peptidoglycan/LPS O-acetylase OafA/YrhL